MTTIHFLASWDEDAGVWVATSKAGRMTTEAPTKQALIERLKVAVPDVLESRGLEPRAKIVIDWQELRTVDPNDPRRC